MSEYRAVLAQLGGAIRALWLWEPPFGQAIIIVVMVLWLALILWLLLALSQHEAEQQHPKALAPVRRTGSRPRRAVLPLELGNVTVDLQPGLNDISHAAVGGTSRLGKSTCVLPLFDLPIGVLTVALDDTVPIREKVLSRPDGIEWYSDPTCPIGLDLLNGNAQTAAEVLVGGFGTIGSGKWQRIARDRLWSVMNQLDARGEQRTLEALCSGLYERVPGNPEATRACSDWADRLMSVGRSLGSALGDDLDLVEAMRHQRKVLLRMNRFLSPLDAPMFGGMLLVRARMVASLAGVPFVLIVEEAGQMGMYQQEIAPLTQAAGARGVSVVLITQNLSLLPLTVSNNVSVWVTFAQEDEKELRFAASKMRLQPEQLYREAFPGKRETQGRGWCYVRAPGVPTTLVKIRQWEPRLERQPKKVPVLVPTVKRYKVSEQRQLDGWRPEPLALPAPRPAEAPWWIGRDPDRLRAWQYMRRAKEGALLWHPVTGFAEAGPCLEWHGAGGVKSKEKYPRPKFKLDGRTVTVYIETFLWAGGKLPDSWTVDHLCNNSVCVEPLHLDACTYEDNNRRRAARAKALAAVLATRRAS